MNLNFLLMLMRKTSACYCLFLKSFFYLCSSVRKESEVSDRWTVFCGNQLAFAIYSKKRFRNLAVEKTVRMNKL